MKNKLCILLLLFSGNYANAQSQNSPPTEVVIRGEYRDALVNELIVLCAYEVFFDSLREERLNVLAKENTWSTDQISKIRQNVSFSNFDKNHFYSAYSRYSQEELQSILTYLKSLTKSELSESKVRHEQVALMNINGHMGGNMDARILSTWDQIK